MDLIEGIKTEGPPVEFALDYLQLWEMDLIEGIKTGRRIRSSSPRLRELWEMDLIEGIKTTDPRFVWGNDNGAGYEKWTW